MANRKPDLSCMSEDRWSVYELRGGVPYLVKGIPVLSPIGCGELCFLPPCKMEKKVHVDEWKEFSSHIDFKRSIGIQEDVFEFEDNNELCQNCMNENEAANIIVQFLKNIGSKRRWEATKLWKKKGWVSDGRENIYSPFSRCTCKMSTVERFECEVHILQKKNWPVFEKKYRLWFLHKDVHDWNEDWEFVERSYVRPVKTEDLEEIKINFENHKSNINLMDPRLIVRPKRTLEELLLPWETLENNTIEQRCGYKDKYKRPKPSERM